MSAALSHRGADALGVWSSESAGLVHRARWATPESEHEEQPWRCAESELVLTADARIDNRGELFEALGLRASAERVIGDAELIGRAFLRWDLDFCEHLLGVFAVAIWDPSSRRLVCARDPFGVKPLYYHAGARGFAFASEIKGILALDWVPRRLNELRVGTYIESVEDDDRATFYAGIERLPAGHRLQLADGAPALERVFALDHERELPQRSDQDFAHEFRSIFDASVEARLRSRRPVGSLLSGGLDSSSIVCSARASLARSGKPLPTFSVVFDAVPECDEREFIEPVVAGGGVEAHFVAGDTLSPLGQLDLVLRHADEPFYGANLYLNWALNAEAARQGVGVILDGTDGDSVVGYGFERLAELAKQGRFPTLIVELAALGPRVQQPRRKLARLFVARPLWRDLVGALPRPLRSLTKAGREGEPTLSDLVRPDFARRIGLLDHLRELRARVPRPRTPRQEHCQGLSSGIYAGVFEILDKAACAHGLEMRFPFFDRRLVEFCVALPAGQRLKAGWTRFILRNAMGGLPDGVRWRPWKTLLSSSFTRNLLEFDLPARNPSPSEAEMPIDPYIDAQALRARFTHLFENRRPTDSMDVCKIEVLARWLALSGLSA
jgi:asparagine synthase (glutamine-hydrolysing)